MAKRTEPATNLEEIFETLSPEPLLEGDEFEAFYEKDVNKVRGVDKIAHIYRRLELTQNGAWYHGLLHGHQGVGKSTELTRLKHKLHKDFRVIRFSAIQDLNPAGYQPFDVLLVMMMKLVRETQEQTGEAPKDYYLQKVEDWFAHKTKTYKQAVHVEAGAAAGAGPKGNSLIDSLLGLFGNVSGAIKYASDRDTTITDYELRLIPELLRLVNELLGECSRILREKHGQGWLFMGEDFDKAIGKPELARDLFLEYGKVFQDLQTHLIFNVPMELVYSDLGGRLEATGCHVTGILDTPVYDRDHTLSAEGRDALRAALERRVSPSLFAQDQMDRFIVASGGNLRDLFSCVLEAGLNADGRAGREALIESVDAAAAINNLRTQYLRHLGTSVSDEQQTPPITYDVKAERLLSIYRHADKPAVTDTVINSLRRSRAVQEFNGEGWYGVHPLVVDILGRQGRIKADAHGRFPGGTL